VSTFGLQSSLDNGANSRSVSNGGIEGGSNMKSEAHFGLMRRIHQIGIASKSNARARELEAIGRREFTTNKITACSKHIDHDNKIHVVMLFDDNAYPQIQIANHIDGSFSLIDGEIFSCTGQTSGDKEVAAEAILAMTKTRGVQYLSDIDASASFSIFDASDHSVLVARDTLGNAPVFYVDLDDALVWASEIPTLLPFIAERRVNRNALDFYLSSGYTPAPWTFFEGVSRLNPGCCVRFDAAAGAKVDRYHVFSGRPALDLAESEIVGAISEKLPIAVAHRESENLPTGILLSGGIDSKILLALAARRDSPKPLAFTFEYLNYDGEFNESDSARDIADRYGVDHHIIPFDPKSLIDGLPDILSCFGEPFSYGVHTVALDLVRDHGVRDLLSGAGADGWYVGSQERRAIWFADQAAIVRHAIKAGVSVFEAVESGLGGLGFEQDIPYLSRAAHGARASIWSAKTNLPHHLSSWFSAAKIRAPLYQDRTVFEDAYAAKQCLRASAVADYSDETAASIFKFLSTRFFGVEMNLNWNHWAARARGLTIRTPYYDRDLFDLVTRLEMNRKDKPELRKYAATLLPHDQAYAAKLPQSVPLEIWMRGPLKEFVRDQLAADRLNSHGLFDGAAVNQLLDKWYAEKVAASPWLLWNILQVTEWQDVFDIKP
jgi:asparagine synthase (glutamine-hydrolysing)